MSRIRTVKPEFFRHELLQALEQANPGQYVMLVFAGLWTKCDKAGRFEWRPKQLKLDILPFLDFDIERTLEILWAAGMVQAYDADGRRYGLIESISEHQRFSGSEARNDPKFPAPESMVSLEALRKHPGSDEEAPRKRRGALEGKGVLERSIRKGVVENSSASGDAAPTNHNSKNWVVQFGQDYTDATEGHIPPGEIGRAIKPLITTHGLEETRSRWNAFIRHADVKYGVQYFAKHFGSYKPGSHIIDPMGDEGMILRALEAQR